jgi:hypothetical protein
MRRPTDKACIIVAGVYQADEQDLASARLDGMRFGRVRDDTDWIDEELLDTDR